MKNVSRRNPCPICGKDDWCGFDSKGGKDYVFCHRQHLYNVSVGDVVNGYYCFKIAKQCAIFEPLEQHEAYNLKEGTYRYIEKSHYVPVKDDAEENVKASVDKRDKAYRALLSLLKLEEIDRQYLSSEGWDEDMITRNNIVSLAPRDKDRYEGTTSINPWRVNSCEKLINMGIDLTNVPGFGVNQKDKWTYYGPAGIVFPCYDFSGRITQLRIRPNFTEEDIKWYKEQDKKPPKYMNFNSSGNKAGARCGIGYSVYEPKDKSSRICYITEGEKKGIVIAEKRNSTAIALQGVSSFNILTEIDDSGLSAIDYLKKKGISTVALCFDADKIYNKYVMGSEEATVKLLKEHGFSIGICNWNLNIAKGIDDLIMKGLNPSIKIVK